MVLLKNHNKEIINYLLNLKNDFNRNKYFVNKYEKI